MTTVFAVMRLVGNKKLSLTDLVSKYYPEYDCNNKGNTTIGNLLQHNSGLPFDYPGSLPTTF
jgi:CubicO group peptidase (beta-lactamase class C family)